MTMTDKTAEYLINSAVTIPWSSANELKLSSYWSSLMHELEGMQQMIIAVDHTHPVVDDLQFLWMIAIERRSMAFDMEK